MTLHVAKLIFFQRGPTAGKLRSKSLNTYVSVETCRRIVPDVNEMQRTEELMQGY